MASVFGGACVALAVLLLLDGRIGAWGAWFAFPAGAGLSAVLAALNGYAYFAYSGFPLVTNLAAWAAATAVLAAVGLAVNLLASRRGSELSEQSNPLHLPVCGMTGKGSKRTDERIWS